MTRLEEPEYLQPYDPDPAPSRAAVVLGCILAAAVLSGIAALVGLTGVDAPWGGR